MMTAEYGHCEESVFAAASFGSSVIYVLDDIDEGSGWGRVALSLMKMYDRDSVISSVHSLLYGTIFHWKGEYDMDCLGISMFKSVSDQVNCTFLVFRSYPVYLGASGPRHSFFVCHGPC